ncbi:MAG TPA: DUF411 domain-containing protein [Rubricoccaceae bacterium]|jgi:hypothetical protein
MSRLVLAALLALAACAPDAPTPAVAPDASSPHASVDTPAPAADADAPVLTVYKSPTCGCCSMWAQAMAREGFRVETVETDRLTAVRDSLGMPGDLAACHTATVGGYTVEGHVPPSAVRRLLAERPDARGIAVPGMPLGSVGMEQGDTRQPYDVLLIGSDGEAAVYEHVSGA